MDEEGCFAIFEGIPEDVAERAEYVDTNAPECTCECHNVSKYSTGAVEDEELLRLVVDDTHVERDGCSLRLKSIFMNDSVTIGSSTLRIGRATKKEIADLIAMLTKGKTKKSDGMAVEVIGYLLIPTAWVREKYFDAHYDMATGDLLPDEKAKNIETNIVTSRSHAIYATGLLELPSHAEIFGCNFMHLSSKSKRNRLAKLLGERVVERFTQVGTIDEIIQLGVK